MTTTTTHPGFPAIRLTGARERILFCTDSCRSAYDGPSPFDIEQVDAHLIGVGKRCLICRNLLIPPTTLVFTPGPPATDRFAGLLGALSDAAANMRPVPLSTLGHRLVELGYSVCVTNLGGNVRGIEVITRSDARWLIVADDTWLIGRDDEHRTDDGPAATAELSCDAELLAAWADQIMGCDGAGR